MAEETKTTNKWETEAGQMAGVVFAYITHYIFMNTGELHRYYKDITGKRLKKVHLFGKGINTGSDETSTHSLLNISRQRYARMQSLEGYHITEKDRKMWEEKFNIDMNFFYMDGNKKVLGCSFEEWKKYIEVLYLKNRKTDTETDKLDVAKMIKETEMVAKRLEEMLADIDMYMGTPIYNIYYYIKYNEKFVARSNLQTALVFLEKARIKEWEDIVGEDAVKYMSILKRHYDYIRMKIDIEKIEMEY